MSKQDGYIEKDVDALLRDLRRFGLEGVRLPAPEERRARKTLTELLSTSDYRSVARAIRFGMKNVWPFTTGQPFDDVDLRKNFTKAVAASRQAERTGDVPLDAQEVLGGE